MELVKVLKKFLRYFTFAFLVTAQLLISCLSFLAFTSTIQAFPWYESGPVAGYVGLLFLIPIQCFVTLYWVMYKEIFIPKLNKIISIINLGILLTITIIGAIKASLFSPFSIFCAIVEFSLIMLLIFSSQRWLIKKQYKDSPPLN